MENRLTRFLKRHGTRTPQMLMWATLRTLYKRESIRRLIRPFFTPRRPEKWIFIVGCYNSGTTITQQILAAHPDVRTLPWEGSLITSVLPDPEDVGWTRMWIKCRDYMRMPDSSSADTIDRLLRDWAPWWGRGGVAFLEKSITNGTRMEWLDRHLAPAYFIGVTRNGYCVAEGIRRKATPRPQIAETFGSEYSVELTAKQWRVANETLLNSSKQVQRYLQIRYEDLLESPKTKLEEIWRFVGLAVPPTTINEHGVAIAGRSIPLSRSMNKGSIGRLSDDDVRDITPVISEMQQQLGYELLPQ